MTATTSRANSLQMSEDFARVYEEAAHRITVPVSLVALDAIGMIGGRGRVLDVAAGAGALSVPAAERGAFVTAVDIAPGMVRRLAEKLEGFPNCEVREMDGEALDLPDDAFDATFSIFGTITFTDWRKGLSEQARVTRHGGKCCVATWRVPPGGGPFQIMISALGNVSPNRPPPHWPEGFLTLSNPDRLKSELEHAGFTKVTVTQIEKVWEGPVGDAYLQEMRKLHQYIPLYAGLDADTRAKVDEAIRSLTISKGEGGRMRLPSPVLIAVGSRA